MEGAEQMINLSQYFLLTSVVAVFPILLVGAFLMFRRRRDTPSIIMLLGAVLIVIGGFFSGYALLESWSDSITMDLDKYELTRWLMAAGGVTTSGGMTIFSVGFIYLAAMNEKGKDGKSTGRNSD